MKSLLVDSVAFVIDETGKRLPKELPEPVDAVLSLTTEQAKDMALSILKAIALFEARDEDFVVVTLSRAPTPH